MVPADDNLTQAVLRGQARPAAREYDRDFQRRLIGEILNAIAEASIISDPNLRIMALRTGEALEALTTCLISLAAMPPHLETPSNLREFAETLAKRFRRYVAKARAEAGLGRDFIFGAQRQAGRA
jgi:hypothetical protein